MPINPKRFTVNSMNYISSQLIQWLKEVMSSEDVNGSEFDLSHGNVYWL